ncbi:MAG: DUF4435 domain-containing protein [Anaerolineae bacterium]|nr:DUF4435 domain-containing protein [Anaerolineae bacterium]
MSTRIIRPLLPDNLTRLLFDLGSRKLILVEGDDDVEVFRIWYRDRLSQVEFYPAEGYSRVEAFLNEILDNSSTKQAYALIDRDFRNETEVEAPLTDPEAHLFILRRYALENYLLEPIAVFEELRTYYGENFAIADSQAMEESLLNLCNQLKPVIAANWIFWDENITGDINSIRYFDNSFPTDDRALLIRETARRLQCLEAEAEQKLVAKEAILNQILVNLNSAYTRVDGKRLQARLFREYRINTTEKHFRRLLARTVRQIGLHHDIRTIVEERILGQNLGE